MPPRTSNVTLRTLDGLRLAGTLVTPEGSRAAAEQLHCEHRLVEIEGAQHGFAVHEDPQYLNPQSQEWQAFVSRTVTEWVTAA